MKTPSIVTLLFIGGLLVRAGEISSIYDEQGLGKSRAPSRFDGILSTNYCGITEIGIERARGVFPGPTYTFIIKSDGQFRYKGGASVERKGEFTGYISLRDFELLAQYIKDSGFMELQDNYEMPVTDQLTAYTMVVMDGKRKAIRNYGDAGPSKLWAIEELIDHLMTKGRWHGSQMTPEKK